MQCLLLLEKPLLKPIPDSQRRMLCGCLRLVAKARKLDCDLHSRVAREAGGSDGAGITPASKVRGHGGSDTFPRPFSSFIR